MYINFKQLIDIKYKIEVEKKLILSSAEIQPRVQAGDTGLCEYKNAVGMFKMSCFFFSKYPGCLQYLSRPR